MSELSPAAQVVLDAVEDDCIHPDDKHRIAAAALCAVVRNNIYNDDYGNEYINANDILRIANELDNL